MEAISTTGRKPPQHLENLAGVLPVALGVAVHEDRLRAELGGGAQRHGGMDSERPRFVGCRRDHAALVRTAPHHHRLAFQGRVEQFFDGNEERVHVQVEDSLHGGPEEMVTGRRAAMPLVPAAAPARLASPRPAPEAPARSRL